MWLQGDLFLRETAVHVSRWKKHSGHPLSWSDVGEAVSAPSPSGPHQPPTAPQAPAGHQLPAWGAAP